MYSTSSSDILQNQTSSLFQAYRVNLQNDYEDDLSSQEIDIVLKNMRDLQLGSVKIANLQKMPRIQKAIEYLYNQRRNKFEYNARPLLQSRLLNPSIDNLRFSRNPEHLVSGRPNDHQLIQDLTQHYKPVYGKGNISYNMHNGILWQTRQRTIHGIGKAVEKQTVWRYCITADGRFVWRSKSMVDQSDIIILLSFILQKRQKQENYIPSILINTGSHGDNLGKNAAEFGNKSLSDPMIEYQIKEAFFKIMLSNKIY